MKWFRVDSDTPRDPKIRSLLQQHGNAGLGALVRLWCGVAEHGRKRPGWAMDSRGRPFPKDALADMAGLNSEELDVLLCFLEKIGHINKVAWRKQGILVFPAMFTRTDVYSRRLLAQSEHTVRTHFAQSAKNVSPTVQVQVHNSTKEQERRYSGAGAPRKTTRKNGHDKDPYPVVLKIASDLLGRIPIRKPVDAVSLKEDVKRRCATLAIPYEGNVVGRAVDSALAVRAKVGEKR